MAIIRKTTIVALVLISLSILGVLVRSFLEGDALKYFSYLMRYGEWYSLKVSLTIYAFVGLLLLALHWILTHSMLKGASKLSQALSIAVVGVITAYLVGAFANGFIITFSITRGSLIALTPIFIIGFALPFFKSWITHAVNGILHFKTQ